MSYTAPPQVFDHDAIIGDTYQPIVVQLLDSDEVAYDLTDVAGECELRPEPGGQVVLTPAVTVDEAEDTFTWSSAAAATATIEPGRYRYAVRLTWPSGVVRTVLEGWVTFRPTALW